MSSFSGLREVNETKELFSFLYTDRGSHYWSTEAIGGRVDKTRLTQVHRPLQQLGFMLTAYSSEAGGRSERVFTKRRRNVLVRYLERYVTMRWISTCLM
jgi:hypothetical protein